MKHVLNAFEANRVISKEVNTQLFQGKFKQDTGDTIDVKRPTDYKTTRTATGDITGQRQSIITGKASATVQDYITVPVDYDEADEALKMDGEKEFWDSIARRIVIDLERDFASYAIKGAALLSGVHGNGVENWSDIAKAGALMQSTGVPMDKKWRFMANPFSQVSLADKERSLGVNPEVATASQQAVVKENFAGMKVMTCNTLATLTTGAQADRVGTLAANPDVTYITAKDTMTQVLSLENFNALLDLKAGDVVQIAGRNRLNLATRDPVIDQAGNVVIWTATVVADVSLDGAGAGLVTVTGPAIFEATGGYNTVDTAPLSGDIVTILGAASTIYQPNLFFHPDAYTICSVPIKKLHSTDTVATTRDGLQLRCSKYSDGDANKQIVRFDLRPAYGTLNPFFAGLCFGNP